MVWVTNLMIVIAVLLFVIWVLLHHGWWVEQFRNPNDPVLLTFGTNTWKHTFDIEQAMYLQRYAPPSPVPSETKQISLSGLFVTHGNVLPR